MAKYAKKMAFTYEANLTVDGDTAVETVQLLVRNGSYRIHRAEFPAVNIAGVEAQYVENMLNSVVRMAANQLRQDGIRDNV